MTRPCVFNTDFSKTGVTQKQLSQMFAGGDTRVPPGLTRPDHWPDKTLAWGRILERILGMAGPISPPRPPPEDAGYVTSSGRHPPVFQQASRLTGQFYISPVV